MNANDYRGATATDCSRILEPDPSKRWNSMGDLLISADRQTIRLNGVLVSWRARPLNCREQPLLDKVHHCHPGQVKCVRVTREDTILKEGTRFVLRKLSSTAAAIVLLHTVIVLVHGTAHMRLKVGLSAWANLYVVCVVGIGPIAGLLLLRSSRQ